MVNRNNFNRKKVKRLKSIRDKKKARINRKKIHLGINDQDTEKPLTKKQQKKQKRLDQIYKQLNVEYKDVFGKNRRRRNKDKLKSKDDKKMDIEK